MANQVESSICISRCSGFADCYYPHFNLSNEPRCKSESRRSRVSHIQMADEMMLWRNMAGLSVEHYHPIVQSPGRTRDSRMCIEFILNSRCETPRLPEIGERSNEQAVFPPAPFSIPAAPAYSPLYSGEGSDCLSSQAVPLITNALQGLHINDQARPSCRRMFSARRLGLTRFEGPLFDISTHEIQHSHLNLRFYENGSPEILPLGRFRVKKSSCQPRDGQEGWLAEDLTDIRSWDYDYLAVYHHYRDICVYKKFLELHVAVLEYESSPLASIRMFLEWCAKVSQGSDTASGAVPFIVTPWEKAKDPTNFCGLGMPKLRASRGTRNRFVPYPNSRPCRGSGISLEARLASLYPRSSNSSSKPLRSVVVRHLIGSNDTKKRTFRTWTRLRDIGLVLELMLEECSTTIQDAIKLFKDFLRRLNGKLRHQNCCIHLPSIRGLSILRDVLVRYHNARLTMPNHERIPEMYEEYIQETVKRMVSLNNFNKLA